MLLNTAAVSSFQEAWSDEIVAHKYNQLFAKTQDQSLSYKII